MNEANATKALKDLTEKELIKEKAAGEQEPHESERVDVVVLLKRVFVTKGKQVIYHITQVWIRIQIALFQYQPSP